MVTDDSRTTRRQFLGHVAVGSTALATVGDLVAARNGDSTTPMNEVTFHEGLTYAKRESGQYQTEGDLKLDLYLPESDEPTPLVVFIHGGGWIRNTRKESPDLRKYFAERGFAMATIDHRLTYLRDGVDSLYPPDESNPNPRGEFPDHIVDVKAAIRWLRAHASEYNIDPDRIATWGSSSGSHLAALAGTMNDINEVFGDVYPEAEYAPANPVYPEESGRVQAVIGWYTPTNFLLMDEQAGDKGAFPHDARGSPESMLIGDQITDDEAYDKVQAANPITYVDPDDPPFLLMHGRQDAIVAYEQSKILYEALRDACVDATFYELHDLGHGFGFEQLTQKPVPEQTVFETQHCNQGSGTGSSPDDHEKHGPPAGPKIMETFLDRHLSR